MRLRSNKNYLQVLQQIHKTMLSSGWTQLFVLLTAISFGTGIAQADSDTCYAVADSVDQLVRLDRQGDDFIYDDVGATGTNNIESIALYLDGTTVYAANANTLGILNTSSGAFTAVGGTFGSGDGALGNITFSDVDGLAFDALTGVFYGTHRRGAPALDVLFQIDRTTGLAVADAFGPGVDYVVIDTTVLSGGLNDIDDIGVDPETGQLYAVANNGGSADQLVKIDKATGAVTDVAVFNDGQGNNLTDVEGLGFYNDGRFYAVTGNSSTISDTFFDVELATATITSILNIPEYSDYEAIACLTGGANHITGTVFVDNDRNGIDDSGAWWPNVDVQLFLDVNGDGFVDAGDILIQTETTDANGNYDFLTAAAGPFVLRVDLATQPAGNSFTTDNIEKAVFPVPPTTSPTFGATDSGNDFGLGTGINTISGTVFNDHINEDGILDPGELGESGVTVRLYEDNNNNGIVDAGDHWTGSVVTDSNGDYSFEVGTGNFVIDIDPSGLPSGATQTTNSPDFTQEADFSNPALSESDTGNDFGFTLPPTDLGVTKESSITGNAAPGDAINYTIIVTNNGSADLTNIVVDDLLPADTTYTPQSTEVIGFAQVSVAAGDFADDFQTDDYTGSTGSLSFASNWVENDEDGGGSSGGNVEIDNDSSCPTPNNYCIELEAETIEDSLYREMDLSPYTSATLTYDYDLEDNGVEEYVVEVSSDGGANYTVLKTYVHNSATGSESFDISAYISSNTRVRFRVTGVQDGADLLIDNFQVSVTSAAGSTTALTKDNIPAGTNTDLDSGVPATLVTADDDFALQPGQSMTVTYSVLVDSPLITLPEFITNTVSVTSDQTPNPARATVSDPIGYDFGDIPASYGDASHIIDPDLYIGSVIGDAESAPASRDGSGDDNAGTNDEDGVSFRSPAGTNQSIFADVVVTNNTGGAVTVCGWLDIPSGSPAAIDGDFTDANEGVCQTTSAANPTLTFQWSNLPNDTSYSTFARFRVSRDPNLVAGAPEITTYDGEISDFALTYDFTPTAVTIGKVELTVVESSDFLTGLNAEQMTETELLALLASWDADLAQALANADRKSILDALIDYLDPDRDGQIAVLAWDTLEERGTIGFYVERREGENGIWEQVNNEMLPGLITAPMGGEYQLADPAARSGQTYDYQLIEQEARGTRRTYGPYQLKME